MSAARYEAMAEAIRRNEAREGQMLDVWQLDMRDGIASDMPQAIAEERARLVSELRTLVRLGDEYADDPRDGNGSTPADHAAARDHFARLMQAPVVSMETVPDWTAPGWEVPQ